MSSDGREVSEEELKVEVEAFDKELDRQESEAAVEDGDENLGKSFMREDMPPERPRVAL